MVFLQMTTGITFMATNEDGIAVERDPRNAAELLFIYTNTRHIERLIKETPRIILINTTKIKITQKNIDTYIKTRSKSRLLTEQQAAQLAKLKVITMRELNLKGDDHTFRTLLTERYDVKNSDLLPLEELIDNESTCAWIDGQFSCLFLALLSKLKDVSLFRPTYLCGGTFYQHILESNLKDFLEFVLLYRSNIKTHSDDVIPESFSECFAPMSMIAYCCRSFFLDYQEMLSGTTRKVILVGDDAFFWEHMIREIGAKFGPFLWQDAINNNEGVILSNANTIITNIDQISPNVFNKLMSLILSSDNKSFLLLQCSSIEHIPLHIGFKILFLPSREDVNPRMVRLIKFILSEHLNCFKDEDEDDEDYLQKRINSPVVLRIFTEIPKLADIEKEIIALKSGKHFDGYSINDGIFWWEFRNYIKEKYSTITTKQITVNVENHEPSIVQDKKESSPEVSDDSPRIEFLHEDGGEKWEVRFVGFDERQYREEIALYYKGSTAPVFIKEFFEDYHVLPIMYITYLAKYYTNLNGTSNNKITAADLYNTVNAWNDKGEPRVANANSINSQIQRYHKLDSTRNIYNKEDFLSGPRLDKAKKTYFRWQLGYLLKGHIIINKNCYFDPMDNIRIIVNDKDKSMPPKK